MRFSTTTTTTATTTTTTTTINTTASTTTSTTITSIAEESKGTTEFPITTDDPEPNSVDEFDKHSKKGMNNNDRYKESLEHDGSAEYQEDQKVIHNNKTSDVLDIPIHDEEFEVLDIEDKKASAEVSQHKEYFVLKKPHLQLSVGLIVGIVVIIICLVVVAVVGGIFWNRKRKSISVIALHKVRITENRI